MILCIEFMILEIKEKDNVFVFLLLTWLMVVQSCDQVKHQI